jgi:hypothetical protein
MTALPEVVRRFAERNAVKANPNAREVILAQEGEMRLSDDARWLSFTAEQRVMIHRTEFCWHARVKMASLVTAVVEDAFEGGHGRLDAKVWGVLPVAHGRGPQIDRGEAQRYLAELPWCPMAILHNGDLRFGEAEHGDVRVFHGDDPDTWIDLRFDEAGDVVGTYTTTRERDGVARPWEGSFADYAELGGVRIPTRGEVKWLMPEGEHTYFRGRVIDLEQRE